MAKKILIVEDDKSISTIIMVNLNMAGYVTDQSFDGDDGLKKAMTGEYDLILLDIMLPGRDGFDICKNLRSNRINTPVIMVTARAEEIDRIYGLDLGADDYVTKPFSVRELLARVKANIRRNQTETVANVSPDTKEALIIVRDLTIDTRKYSVSKKGEPIELSKKEYEVLVYLASNLDEIITRDQLFKMVWGYGDYSESDRTVDVTMTRLRSKIEDDTQNPVYIKTRRGQGYYMPR